uniref:ATP synthase F0 subunit 8 n=2 Tax=Cicadellini TaxID=565680 RepID=A0A9E9G080_9HEMI|nr:ATP synthase F0 subunit 8 [Stenatkina angustata]YP_010610814.1 ATP synthase F0 subunit 8 [Paratkina nigrifasciana]WAP91622.1 ATP synthase F0 subunit 8 [Stenatkina angustata]WAP91635.1 ATP synthase F0 subunit 8 [Paratkina nigrifasciana]
MPQMSPMWWTFLMLIFISLFLLLMSMMYFYVKVKYMKKNKINSKMYNWKL